MAGKKLVEFEPGDIVQKIYVPLKLCRHYIVINHIEYHDYWCYSIEDDESGISNLQQIKRMRKVKKVA